MTIDFDTPEDPEFDDFDSNFDTTFEEETAEEGGSNSLFVVIAAGLAGLILLGILAIGGILLLRNMRNDQTLAQITPQATPTLAIVEELPTATNTPTPVPADIAPVDTEPTATNTPVVVNNPSEGADAEGTVVVVEVGAGATATPVAAAGGDSGSGDSSSGDSSANPEEPETVPDTGFGGFEMVLLAGGLLVVLFVSRRMRQQSA